jgi:hypothetical protein
MIYSENSTYVPKAPYHVTVPFHTHYFLALFFQLITRTTGSFPLQKLQITANKEGHLLYSAQVGEE